MSDTGTASDVLVLRKDENGICHLTMNRPKAYNALSMEMMSALVRGLILRTTTPRKALFNAAMLGTAAGAGGLAVGVDRQSLVALWRQPDGHVDRCRRLGYAPFLWAIERIIETCSA